MTNQQVYNSLGEHSVISWNDKNAAFSIFDCIGNTTYACRYDWLAGGGRFQGNDTESLDIVA